MKDLVITVNGTDYNCRPTMGAMLRFKRETGKEITEINAGSVSDLCTYLYCCVASSARRDGKEFGLSLMDFADSISPSDMEAWSAAVAEFGSEAGGEEKKSL